MYRPLPQLCKPEAKRKQEAKGKQDAKREQGVKREQEAEEQAKRPSGLIQRRFIGTLAKAMQGCRGPKRGKSHKSLAGPGNSSHGGTRGMGSGRVPNRRQKRRGLADLHPSAW